MLFNSAEFLFVFFPLVWAVSHVLKSRAPKYLATWLLASSLTFYATGARDHLALFVASIAANYFFGLKIDGASSPRQRRLFVGLGVACDLLLISYFKYLGFFVEIAQALVGAKFEVAEVTLPIGISFYTFQQIAYLVDVFRGERVERNIVRYAFFVSFFPHLIAGPLVYHKELLPQLDTLPVSWSRKVTPGLTLLVIGLFKKMAVADTVALESSRTFSAVAMGLEPGLIEAWSAALCFTLQIYFDFSGYSDMAVGLGRMLGFEMPINFASPYKAQSIIDFWRRWHITLSRFLRDYLYVSLGGSRKGPLRRHVNLMLTMLLGGLWHGAGWPFILWGGMHGTFLLVNHSFRSTALSSRLGAHGWWKVVALLLTFCAVVFAWIPFRADSLEVTLRVWGGMVGIHGVMGGSGVRSAGFGLSVLISGLLGLVWFAPNSYEFMEAAQLGTATPGYPATHPTPRPALQWNARPAWAVVTALLSGIILLKLNDVSEFIYFRF